MKGTVTLLKYDQLTIHDYLSPIDGEMTCSHIIETKNKLIIIDVQLLRSYAKEVRDYADHLNKPIDRVIITHIHPDHWFGLEYFTDVPIYALLGVKEQIRAFGDQIIQFKKSEYADLITSKLITPTCEITVGQENIDGVNFLLREIVDAEVPLSLLVELPEMKIVIAQDIVYNQVYLVIGEKDSAGQVIFNGWINVLTDLKKNGYDVVLPGHGVPTDSTIFSELIDYISYVKIMFESGIGEDELKASIIEKYPHYQVPHMLDLSNIFLYHQDW